MFAGRGTRRFNPIGMTLAHLDKVEGRTLFLSGIDIIHGTPVVDIKPYHYKDAVAPSTVHNLIEMSQSGVTPEMTTQFLPSSMEELKEIIEC